MTREEIILLAEGAGFFVKENEAYSPSNQEDHELTPHLECFTKLVAEHEREACAKRLEAVGAAHCAENIRARGQE